MKLSSLFIASFIVLCSTNAIAGERMICESASNNGANLDNYWTCHTKSKKVNFNSMREILNSGWSPLSAGVGNGSTTAPGNDFKPWFSVYVVIFDK